MWHVHLAVIPETELFEIGHEIIKLSLENLSAPVEGAE